MADIENVIIIGSGPAGYTAALYTARANLRPLVIEGFAWGGLLQQTTDVENYPGYPEGISGPEMMQQLRDQAERFGTRFITDQATGSSSPTAGRRPHRSGSTTRSTQARTVILAMGAEHRKLGVPGEDELGGRGVSYCATCDAAFFKDNATIIVGGGDSAMEEALFLAKFASKVTIVHRRDEFRASKIMLDRARAEREHRVADALRGRRVPRRREGRRSTGPRSPTSRPARSARSRCLGRSSPSATNRSRSSSTGRSTSTTTATSRSTGARPGPTARACSRPATSSTTPTARR